MLYTQFVKLNVWRLAAALCILARRTETLVAPTPEPATNLLNMLPWWILMLSIGNTRPFPVPRLLVVKIIGIIT
jgi:hypothetical protein